MLRAQWKDYRISLRSPETGLPASIEECERLVQNEPPEGIGRAFIPLLAARAKLEELEHFAEQKFDEAGPALVLAYLGLLADNRMIIVGPAVDLEPSYVPYSQDNLFELLACEKPDQMGLSRFLLVRRREGNSGILVESPLALGHLEIGNPELAAVVARMMTGGEVQLSVEQDDADFSARLRFLGTVASLNGFSRPASVESASDECPYWEFHDLYFHSRSRLGRHGNPAGATFRMAKRFPSEPALRTNNRGAKIYLAIPSFDDISRFDPPLSVAMSSRRSHRVASATALTRVELGHFLYRCAFVHGITTTPHGEFTRRVYPSGGGSYELEIYILVNRVSGLYPGVYLYDCTDNSMLQVNAEITAYRSLLNDAYTASADSGVPDALFVLASRIRRLSWKYSAISYATTLKNVGVLYANMYLVATAMDLAPCALGLGNSDTFARLTGTDYLSECAVGEFMLSRRS